VELTDCETFLKDCDERRYRYILCNLNFVTYMRTLLIVLYSLQHSGSTACRSLGQSDVQVPRSTVWLCGCVAVCYVWTAIYFLEQWFHVKIGRKGNGVENL
jgi:hypothetical protein